MPPQRSGGHRFDPHLYEDPPGYGDDSSTSPRNGPRPGGVPSGSRPRDHNGAPAAFAPARPEPPSYRDPPPPSYGEPLERQRLGLVSPNAGAPPSYGQRPENAVLDAMEGGPPPDLELIKCEQCGRSFNEKALARHMKICKNVFVEKRKPFQSAESRLQGLEGANDLIANAKEIQKDLNSANGIKKEKESKQNKWRLQSEQLRSAMQAMRGDPKTRAEAEERIQRMQEEANDLLPCPHCGRKFNKEAGERHIPICQKTFSNGGRLKKGGGTQCSNNAMLNKNKPEVRGGLGPVRSGPASSGPASSGARRESSRPSVPSANRAPTTAVADPASQRQPVPRPSRGSAR